jgi:hypothetical protein
MNPQKQAFGYVIRKDGTIPFDDDPNRHPEHKAAVMQDLGERGHASIHTVEGHLVIQNWDPDKGLNPHPNEIADANDQD